MGKRSLTAYQQEMPRPTPRRRAFLSAKRIQLFRKRHKLTLQELALLAIVLVPILLYWAAAKGDEASLLILLVLLGVGVACAIWVS